jgi:hypothetical protein
VSCASILDSVQEEKDRRFTAINPMPADHDLSQRASFPLDGSRWFAGHVIDDAVDAFGI